jgi:gliding motility-associated-like protein
MRKNTLGFTVFILVFSGFLNLGYACKYLKHTSEDSFLKKELAFLNFLDGGLNKEKFSFYFDTVSSIDVDSGNSLLLDEDDCSVTTLPYSENFNTYGTGSDAFPNCWERPVTYTSGSVWPSIVSAYSVSSPNSLRFQSEVGIPTYAISPAFVEDLHNLRVRFQLKREGTSSGTMDIGVMSDPLDTATFELVETIDPADNNFHEYVFNLNETTLSGGDNYIAVRHNSNANNWYYWLDDFMVELIPSCLEPDALTVTAPTTTGATLGWASNGDLFDIEIVEAGEDPTGTPTESGVSNPHTTTDLSVSTSYEFYVRRDCGDGDLSVWVGPFAFATACDVITDLPYTENFDTYGTGSDAFPNCWERPVVYSGYPSIVSTYSVSSPNSLRFQSEVGIPTYAVSPAFAEDIHNLRVRFQLKREGTSSGTMDIGVMSDPLDTATFELVETINPADNNFHEYVFNLNEITLSGGDNYIAVRHNSNANNWYYWMDNFVVELLPSCLEPDALTVTAPTTTGATLGWTSNGDLFDIEIVEAGEDPTGTPTESGVSNPYIATALDSSTIYEYYVRQDCGDGDLSEWSGPFEFATACEVITDLPYTENFDTYGTGSDAFPDCWERPVMYSGYPSIVSVNSVSSPNSLRFQSLVGTPTYAVSPAFAEDINNLRVRFQLKREGTSSGTMDIGVMSDPLDITTFELVGTINPADNDYHEYVFNLDQTTLSGGDNYIAVRQNSTSSAWYYWMDNFVVELLPSCVEPGSLTVTAPTTTGATLGWASNGDLFDIEIVGAGENPTGTPTESGVTNPYTATELSASTTYEYYVRQDCGDGDLSEWSGPFAFATACDVITDIPYTENFDVYGTGSDAFPNCWERPVMYSGYPSIVSVNSVSSPNSLRFQSLVGTPTYAVSPAFAEDINNLRVRFQLKREGTSSGTMDVGVMSDPLDITTFELVATINPDDNNHHEYVFNLNETTLSGGDNYIAVRQNSTSSSWYYWMDNFVVERIPDCLEPSNLDIQITCDVPPVANITWDAGGSETSWEYALTSPGDPEPEEGTVVTENSVTIELEPGEDYVFWVRGNCGEEDGLSYWINTPFNSYASPVAQAQPFCAGDGGGIIFPNGTNTGNVYGSLSCLGTTPNPVWYFLQIDQPGTLDMQIIQNVGFDENGDPFPGWQNELDVDFIAWGPFESMQDACQQIDLNNPTLYQIACSYSSAPIENFTIPNAQEGEIYVLLITNYENEPGFIKLEQTNLEDPDAGNTDCSFLCKVDLGDDIVACSGTEVVLQGKVATVGGQSEVTAIRWFFEDELMDPEVYNELIITVTEAGTYRLEVEKDKCTEDVIFDEILVTFKTPYEGNIKGLYDVCDDDNDGKGVYDLKTWIEEGMSQSPSLDENTWSLYPSQEAAEAGQEEDRINIEDSYVTEPKAVYVRIEREGIDCYAVVPINLTLKPTVYPVVGFSYDAPICINNIETLDIMPIEGFTFGGVFGYVTAGSGKDPFAGVSYDTDGFTQGNLRLNRETGQIDVQQSKAGKYEITYFYGIPEGSCGEDESHTVEITIFERFQIDFDGDCFNGKYRMRVIDVLENLDLDTATYRWEGPGTFTGTSREVEVSQTGIYRVYFESIDGCYEELEIDLENINCLISKGISPNGDGLNDYFDLSQYKVVKFQVFNRNGVEVYSHGQGYTNEWHGQDKSGNNLPDGTYFYVLQTLNESMTGWIQLNR